MTLPTRPLGRGGPVATRLGLGLAALGRPAYHNLGHAHDLVGRTSREGLETHAHAVLDHAWARGVRVLDTARSYGEGEAFLGRWLDARDIAPGSAVVGSKWGYTYVGDWRRDAEVHEVKDHGLSTFLAQAEQTIARLGPWLSTYSIHSATLDTGVLDDGAVLEALDAFAADHGVRLGLTVTGPAQAATLRHALDQHAERFSVVQATFNVLEPSVGDALAEAHAAGWGVVVKEGVANGRLTDRSDDAHVLEVLGREARRLGTTPDALALAWVLAHDTVDVVLSGASTVAQLDANLAAVEVVLDDEAHAALSGLARPAEAYWAHRRTLAWT